MRILCSSCSHVDVCSYKYEYNRLKTAIDNAMNDASQNFNTELKCTYYTSNTKEKTVIRNNKTNLIETEQIKKSLLNN